MKDVKHVLTYNKLGDNNIQRIKFIVSESDHIWLGPRLSKNSEVASLNSNLYNYCMNVSEGIMQKLAGKAF